MRTLVKTATNNARNPPPEMLQRATVDKSEIKGSYLVFLMLLIILFLIEPISERADFSGFLNTTTARFASGARPPWLEDRRRCRCAGRRSWCFRQGRFERQCSGV